MKIRNHPSDYQSGEFVLMIMTPHVQFSKVTQKPQRQRAAGAHCLATDNHDWRSFNNGRARLHEYKESHTLTSMLVRLTQVSLAAFFALLGCSAAHTAQTHTDSASPTTHYPFENPEVPINTNRLIHTEKICGVKEIFNTCDNKSILIATLQLEDCCPVAVVYTDFQPSTPQLPSLYSTNMHFTRDDHFQGPSTEEPGKPHKLKPFPELATEESFITCMSNDTDGSTILAELQDPQTWAIILSQLTTVTDELLRESYSEFTPQRHFPEDIKGHIDSKRWIHLVSLLVLIKDIVEQNIAFMNHPVQSVQ